MFILSITSDAIAIFLMWLFISAGIQKLYPKDKNYFAIIMKNYGWKSTASAPLIAKLLGSFELLLGLTIVIPTTRTTSALLAATLLFVYMLLMAYQLNQGRRDIECGCGGPGNQLEISELLLLRNIILIGLAYFCLNTGSAFQFSYWSLSAAFSLLIILIYQSSEQLMSNADKLKTLRV